MSLRRQPGESDADYYMRILERYPSEGYGEYKDRILATKELLSDLPIWSNKKYVHYAPVDISEEEKIRKQVKINGLEDKTQQTKDEKKKQVKIEQSDMFFRRVLERRSGESRKMYNTRIEKICKVLPELKEWKNTVGKVRDTTKNKRQDVLLNRPITYAHEIYLQDNYIGNIHQYPNENEKQYFERLLERHPHENVEGYTKRLAYLMNSLPQLRIWDIDPYTLHVPGRYTATEIIEEIYYEE